MSIHGRAAWDYIPNPPRRSPFFGGAEGGGGGGGCRVHPPMRGGVPWARRPLRGRTSDSPGGTPLYGMVCYSMVWYGMVWYGMVWYGMVWYGRVWCGAVRYGTVRYGTVRYGTLLLLLLLRRSARAGGRNCQTRSPWAERKGAVGRRYAGQAGADDDRGGGGGSAFCPGGKGGAHR